MDSAASSPSTNGFEPGIERKPFVENGKPDSSNKRGNIETNSWKKSVNFKKGQDFFSTMDNWAIFLILLLALIAILLMVFFIGYFLLNGLFISSRSSANVEEFEKSHLNQEKSSSRGVTALVFKSDEMSSMMTTTQTILKFFTPTSTTTEEPENESEEHEEHFESTSADTISSGEVVFHSFVDEDIHPLENYGGRKIDRPMEDCFVHLAYHGSSGIYTMKRGDIKLDAYCDMESADGGWTVIQRRIDGSENFHNRGYNDYVQGFGSLQGSHWLGLENIHTLAPSTANYVTLRIELHGDSCNGEKCSNDPTGFWFGEWDFRLGDQASGYQLDISPATKGNLSTVANHTDGFYALSNGQSFTTIDKDMDEQPDFNCAQFRMFGPWWHSNCTTVALNGFYGDKKPVNRYMMWAYTEPKGRLGLSYPIHPIKSVMMIKPKF